MLQKLLLKVVHKTVETTGKLIENKIVEETVKLKPVVDENSKKSSINRYNRERTRKDKKY